MSVVPKLAWFGCVFDGDHTHLGVLDWSPSQNISQESCDSSIGTRATIIVRPSSPSGSGSRCNNTRSNKSPWRYALDLSAVFQRILFAAAKLTTLNPSISSRTPLPHKRLLYSGGRKWSLSLASQSVRLGLRLYNVWATPRVLRRVAFADLHLDKAVQQRTFHTFVHSSFRRMSNPFADVLALSLSLTLSLFLSLSFS